MLLWQLFVLATFFVGEGCSGVGRNEIQTAFCCIFCFCTGQPRNDVSDVRAARAPVISPARARSATSEVLISIQLARQGVQTACDFVAITTRGATNTPEAPKP